MVTRFALVAVFCLAAIPAWAGEEQVLRTDHVTVRYVGVQEAEAQAIARVVERARQLAVDRFGFDMPDAIQVAVDCRPANSVRLYNDGQDRFVLSVRNPADLRRPQASGIYHLYGLCHEVGHLAMYRAIKRHDWMTTACAEGWAHYIGSRLVDQVYEAEGEKAWSDPYDYRADGTRRLEAQIARAQRDPTVDGAALWRDLAGIVGDKRLAALCKAWGEAQVQPDDPAAALKPALLALADDAKLAEWWKRAEPIMVSRQARSEFEAKTVAAKDLANQPLELTRDDGKSAGMKSMAGGGHAVLFDGPGEGWYLASVRIYGARYGALQPPAEDFRIWLCDEEGKVVRQFGLPYRLFQRGQAGWVKIPLEPTQVPRRFMIVAGFNPTGSKGVFVHHDGGGSGNSRSGLPGGGMRNFEAGDWMIRAVVDQARGADPLR